MGEDVNISCLCETFRYLAPTAEFWLILVCTCTICLLPGFVSKYAPELKHQLIFLFALGGVKSMWSACTYTSSTLRMGWAQCMSRCCAHLCGLGRRRYLSEWVNPAPEIVLREQEVGTILLS